MNASDLQPSHRLKGEYDLYDAADVADALESLYKAMNAPAREGWLIVIVDEWLQKIDELRSEK